MRSREDGESSNAEALIGECAKRSLGLALDQVLFDAVAGDAVRPSGLRFNVVASTAAGGGDSFEKMLADIATLLGVVAPVGGPVVFVASEARAAMARARSRGGVLPVVLGSPAIAPADLLAIAVDALVTAIDPTIEVEAGRHGTIHIDDAPLPLASVGPTVAAPQRALFQTDSTALRLKLDATWAVRHPQAVSWMSTTW